MRIPLLPINDTRDPSRAKDAWGTNCLIEEDAGEKRLLKRPGLVPTIAVVAPGLGQGVFHFNDQVYEVISDILYIQVPYASSTNPPVPTQTWIQM